MTVLLKTAASPRPSTAAGPYASFQQTVPRSVVHRAAVSEVLLTDWQALGDDVFLLGAQWPRAHSFYRPIAGAWHDPMLSAETMRQAGLLIAHEGFGVPQGHQFFSKTLISAITAEGLRMNDAPADVTVKAACHDIQLRAGKLTALRVRMELFRDETWIGSGGGSYTIVSENVYRRLRPPASPSTVPLPMAEPLAPGLVGRDAPADVVLAGTTAPNTWLLRVDPRHPVLFDHPVDHVPGMLLMEAMRQAVHRATSPYSVLPAEFDTEYFRFVELDRPCLVTTHPATPDREGRVQIQVRIEQDGELAATGTVLAQRI